MEKKRSAVCFACPCSACPPYYNFNTYYEVHIHPMSLSPETTEERYAKDAARVAVLAVA